MFTLAAAVVAAPAFAQSEFDDADASDGDAPNGTVFEPTDVARSLYNRGVDHFELGDWEAAAVLFEEAYRYDPRPRLAYNVGRSWDRAGNTSVARVWYERAMISDDEELLARVADALAELERDPPEEAPWPDVTSDAIGDRVTDARPARPGRTRRMVGGSVFAIGATAIVIGAATGSRARSRYDIASQTDDPGRFDDLVAEGQSARSASMGWWTTGLVTTSAGAGLALWPTRGGPTVDVAFNRRSARVGVRF